MSSPAKLSLRSAILINLNIMVGFGIFINTVVLAKLTGALGFVCYGLVAVLIFPLIYSIAQLMRHHADGSGFYSYAAKDIHPFAGFLSAWIYFTGKLASAALIIHVVMTLLQSIIPVLRPVPTLLLDIVVILLFTFLNTFHLGIGSSLAAFFISLKLTPILFAICAGLYLVTTTETSFTPMLWDTIPSAIPFVLYAFTGFEAACSLSKSIENPQRNGPRAIFISFALAVIINVLYQFLFYVSTHGLLMTQENYLGAFPTLLHTLLPTNTMLAKKIVGILHLALACSALGGSYGILFSNHWNLYTLADHGHTFFRSVLTRLNRHHIPVACVIVEACVCIGYLVVTQGNQAPLQQLSALGSTIAYTISIIGLIALTYITKETGVRAIAYAGLGSCIVFIGSCIRNFFIFGSSSLLVFVCIVVFGIGMYAATSTHFQRHER